MSLWSRPHFQFFPMAWLGFVYFASLRMGAPRTTQSPLRMAAGIGLTFLSFFAAAESILISSPWLTYVAGVILVVAWMLFRAGELGWASAIGLTSLLWMTVPLPAGYDNKLIQFLQMQSSSVASLVLDCIGILHLPEGNVIELAHKRLFVDEACSGVDSLYALMAICLSIVLWLRQRLVVAIVSLSLVPVWASCSNIARLIAIVLGIDWLDIDLSHGTPHTILGMVVFAGAFMCDFAFIQFAGALLGKKTPASTPSFSAAPSNRSTLSGKLGIAGTVVFVVSFVALGTYATKALSMRSLFRFPHFSQETLVTLKQMQVLPEQLADWRYQSFQTVERNSESAFGQYSHVWSYVLNSAQATISTDFPFRGFHLLDICYQGAGWRLKATKQVELYSRNEAGVEEPFYSHLSDMKNDEGNYAFVAYALFQLDGTPVRSIAKGARGFERFEQTILEPVTFQIQVVVTSNEEITPAMKQVTQANLQEIVAALKPSFRFLSTQKPVEKK